MVGFVNMMGVIPMRIFRNGKSDMENQVVLELLVRNCGKKRGSLLV